MNERRPYDGLTVVEAVASGADDALFLAAGLAGRILADLGAKVICFEGDDRGLDPSLRLFLSQRKTVVRDHAEAEVTAALAAADAAMVDAVSLRGLGRDAFPKLVAALSLFGGRHAGAETGASAFTVSALAGLLAMVGDPDREPLKLGGHQETFVLGLSAYCGLAAALAAPRPQRLTVRASLFDAIVWLNWKAVPLEADAGVLPTRAGAAGEWQVLPCADGYAALVYQEPDWPRLKSALAEPLLEEPRFATRAGRLANAVALAEMVGQRFLTMTRHQIHDLARRHKLPLGPVWSLDDAFSDPHNKARGLFEPVTGGFAEAMAPRLPVCWNGGPVARRNEAAAMEEAAQ